VSRLADLHRRPFGRPEAAFYEWVAAPAVSSIVAPVLAEQVRPAASGAVLDLGCGGGAIAARLREAGRSVIGIDPSIPQLRRVRRSTAVPSIAATADALPLRLHSFAAVVSSCAVKHWTARLDGLIECVRLLQPGGALVIVEIDGGQDDNELRRFASLTRIPPGLRRLYPSFARRTFVPVSPSAEELLADCETAGAVDLRTWRIPQLPFFVVAGVRPP
jgi:SAM-dependent methyltransferase